MTEHTPTPWAYRPNEHDDWGWIRDADGNLAATARDGRVWSEHFDRYRAAKTDPYEPNAAFIIKAVNNHDALVKALEEIEDLGANGETAARLGNIAHAALIALRNAVGAQQPRAPSSQPVESAGAKTGGGK